MKNYASECDEFMEIIARLQNHVCIDKDKIELDSIKAVMENEHYKKTIEELIGYLS